MIGILDEHLEYLTLTGREQLFDAAIASVLHPGCVVADLGCGFGVLGMQCLRAGAGTVYGIDASNAIQIARETVARAGLTDQYHCISGSTFQTKLPEKVDLIICDHVGWFGVDYGIISMLEDARQRMLKPGGQVVPHRIRLFIAGTSSDDCRTVVDAWDDESIPKDYRWLREYQVNTKHPRQFKPGDLCTPPVMVGEIDLRCDQPDSLTFETNLVADSDTRFDGIAGWFECELAQDVWMTNSPLAEHRIERNQIFLAAKDAFRVTAGEQIGISLKFRKEGNILAWSITPPNGQRRQKMSTWSSAFLNKLDLSHPETAAASLSPIGTARMLVLSLVDGKRSGGEIERALAKAHPEMFPTPDEIGRFVRRVLASDASF